jgi:hypothetical protein
MFKYCILEIKQSGTVCLLRIKNKIEPMTIEMAASPNLEIMTSMIFPTKIIFNNTPTEIVEFIQKEDEVVWRVSSKFIDTIWRNNLIIDLNDGHLNKILDFQDDKSALLWLKLEHGV